jgi:hypothetical protein
MIKEGCIEEGLYRRGFLPRLISYWGFSKTSTYPAGQLEREDDLKPTLSIKAG